MQLKNTENSYGMVTLILHWGMAVIIVALLVLGLYMTRVPVSPLKFKLYGWHKEVGILILMLAMIRVVWWSANILPVLPATLPRWQKMAAHAVHAAFYVFMFLLPLSGWLMSSAAGFPVSFFGWFLLPDLITPHEGWRVLLSETHEWLGYGLIATFCAHVGAALKHHFINKDNILRRMLP